MLLGLDFGYNFIEIEAAHAVYHLQQQKQKGEWVPGKTNRFVHLLYCNVKEFYA